jgi:hypothetical protein
MELNSLSEAKTSYARQRVALNNVLNSPRCYLSDFRLLSETLWKTELDIIDVAGTIYNGL